MTFEVPSYVIFMGILTFASTQGAIMWQLAVLIGDFRDYKNKLSEFREECEQRFARIEMNCVKHHGG